MSLQSSIINFFKDNGILTQAFSPLQKVLSEPFLTEDPEMENKSRRLPPRGLKWTRISGKGGQKYPHYFDISLYRHCQEVALFASILLYYAYSSDRLTYFDVTDETSLIHATRQLIAIAFAHDADKYYEAERSSSPSLKMVSQVYDDLKMETWTDWTPHTLFTAVNYVELRGNATAIFGTTLSKLQYELAQMVSRADRLVSVAAKEGVDAFIDKYNQIRENLHIEYGFLRHPIRLVQIRENPALLHALKNIIYRRSFEEHRFYPFILNIQGETLSASVLERFDWQLALNDLQARLIENTQPTLVRAAMTGDMTLRNVHVKEDLDIIIEENEALQGISIHTQDWPQISSIFTDWAIEQNGLKLTQEPEGKLFFVIQRDKNASSVSNEYLLVLKIIIALRGKIEDFEAALSFEQKCHILLTRQDQRIQKYLDEHGITFSTLKNDSKQSLLAILTVTLLITQNFDSEEEIFQALYQTGYPEQQENPLGIVRVLQSIAQQLGITFKCDVEESHDLPYQAIVSSKKGHCLLCGVPTDKKLDGRTFPKNGYIKSSAFGNRIGYRKELYRSVGENYICESCVTKQTALLELAQRKDVFLNGTPLIIATPIRHILYEKLNKEKIHNLTLRQFHKEDGFFDVSPWQTDFTDLVPFFFEERPNDPIEMVDKLLQSARYALWSGEPIHIFISAQHTIQAAWYCEIIPEMIRPLIFDNGRQLLHPERTYPLVPDETGGLRRDQLPMLVDRLKLIQYILRNPSSDKYTVLQAMPHFGWWPEAWLFQKSEDHTKTADTYLSLAQEIFSMDFDTRLKELAQTGLELQGYGRNYDSHSEVTFSFDKVLEAYDQYQQIYFRQEETNAQPYEESLMSHACNYLQLYLERRYNYVNGKKCYSFAENAIQLLLDYMQKGELDPQSRRFIRSAYAGFFNRLRFTKKSTDDNNE